MSTRWGYYILGIVLGLVVLLVRQIPAGHARMVVCDVGQGDAILIIKGSNQVLVDGGPSSEKMLSCLERHVPFWDRRIELIVLTNTDYDHMQGLVAVIDRYQVIEFVTSDGVHGTDALSQFGDTLQRQGVVARSIEQGDWLQVGSNERGSHLEFQVLWPPDTIEEYVAVFRDQINGRQREQILGASAKRGDLNERSVVLLLLEAGKQVLLTGDIGFQTEQSLLEQGRLSDIDILKVGHHGSKYASGAEFLVKIHPELAVISAGTKNRYGHPTQETLDRLSKVGAEIKRTDQDGDIVLELN